MTRLSGRGLACLFLFMLFLSSVPAIAWGAGITMHVRVKLIERHPAAVHKTEFFNVPTQTEIFYDTMHDKFMKRLDRSRDGLLSFNEFKLACARNTQNVFTALDLDDNRRIDRDEIEFYAMTVRTEGCRTPQS